MRYDFDLITLGAGSGGIAASRRAAAHGARVAAIEGSRVGGTCVIRGCVPKKLLMYAAEFRDSFAEAAGYGWDVGTPAFSMQRWAEAKSAETHRLERMYRQMLSESSVQLIEGWARIEGPNTVVVGEQRLTASHLLVATGAAPVSNSIPGIEACPTSDDLLDLKVIPESVAIVGGGFIAVEFASMLARLGTEVTLCYRDRLPLRGFDEMLRSAAAAELQSAGIRVRPGCVPTEIRRDIEGFDLHFPGGKVLRFPWVLNATGRRPNTNGLGLESVGITLGPQGSIPVNQELQTVAPNVFAIGDVTNRMNLTPLAIAEGRMLADSLYSEAKNPVDLSVVPSAVFMLPPLSSVGPSEAKLLESGQFTNVYEAEFRPMKTAFLGYQSRTRMKLLVDGVNDRVLGAHMVGANAPEIMQILSIAITARVTKAEFDRTIALHPTVAEEFVLMRNPTRTIGKA